MPNDNPPFRQIPNWVWVIAFVLSVALPFLCLRAARVIGWVECLIGVCTGLLVHVGMVTVLAKSDGDPLSAVTQSVPPVVELKCTTPWGRRAVIF